MGWWGCDVSVGSHADTSVSDDVITKHVLSLLKQIGNKITAVCKSEMTRKFTTIV